MTAKVRYLTSPPFSIRQKRGVLIFKQHDAGAYFTKLCKKSALGLVFLLLQQIFFGSSTKYQIKQFSDHKQENHLPH